MRRSAPTSCATATRYAAAGYGHGHRVALLLENRPEFFFHYLALNALGCSIVPINPDYRHDEMLYQMDHSEADLAVVVASRVADLEAVARARARPLPVVNARRCPRCYRSPVPPPRGRRARSRDASAACSTRPARPGGRRAASSRTSTT